MKKISLKEIARGIRTCEFAPKKWEFETIEQIEETKETSFGKKTKYLLTIRFPASKYDDNGMKFQVCHYEDNDAYAVFFDGNTYLG